LIFMAARRRDERKAGQLCKGTEPGRSAEVTGAAQCPACAGVFAPEPPVPRSELP
jgi:hypothetical protein